jgi:hypothetical protein
MRGHESLRLDLGLKIDHALGARQWLLQNSTDAEHALCED